MKLIQTLLVIALIIMLTTASYSQQVNLILDKPEPTDFSEGNIKEHLIIGEEGNIYIKLKMNHPAVYWTEDRNNFYWEGAYEKKVRLRIPSGAASGVSFIIDNKTQSLKYAKPTIHYMKNGIMVSEKLTKKSFDTHKQGDTTYYSIITPQHPDVIILDYSYTIKAAIPKMHEQAVNLSWSLNESYAKKYSSIQLLIPEYFEAEMQLEGVNINDLKIDNGVRLETITGMKLQKELEENISGQDLTLTYSLNFQSYTAENLASTKAPSAIKLSAKQIRKVFLQ